MTDEQKQDNSPVSELEVKLKKELRPIQTGAITPSLLDIGAVDQMLLANQLKYIEAQLDADEENKLFYENIEDFEKYPIEVQNAAIKHVEASQFDSEYFTRNNVDEALHKPMTIYTTIKAKREEAKNKVWTTEYRARLIGRLRDYRSQLVSRITKRSFFQRLFNITPVDDHGHTLE